MRFRTGRLIAAALLAAGAGAAAVAATAGADPPGNNGDVKIEITGFFALPICSPTMLLTTTRWDGVTVDGFRCT